MNSMQYIPMMRRRGVDPCAYVPGKYTEAEVDDLINIHGYVPVASADEFLLTFTYASMTNTMGGCTKWKGDYVTNQSQKYIQVGVIDFSDLPQGINSYENNVDYIFDGNNLEILNFSSSRSGLIRLNNGAIKNINISGSVVNSDSASGSGILVSINNGSITNCIISGDVSSITSYTAGLCGINNGNITNCAYSGNVNSSGNIVGLFVGQNTGLIELCSASGVATQNRAGGNCFLGGFLGANASSGTIKECSFIGDVDNINADATRRQMGGFVGSNRDTAKIVNCFSIGTINGGSFVGGFCGNTTKSATIQNSYCSVAVSFSGSTIGGFNASGGGITDCYYDSNVSLVSGGIGTPKTTSELQTPTSATGIYANWNADAWDFGTATEYPTLSGISVPLPDNSIINGVMIVEMGQSNMEGRFGDSPLDTSPVGTAYFWDGAAAVHLVNDRGGATGGSHATYFANRLFNLSGNRPIMVESAASGAGLTPQSATTNWSDSGTMRGLTETQVADVIAAIPNITAPTAGLWCQGERDAQEMDSNPSYTPAIVEAAMQDVIDWWQAEYPGVPFLISQTGRPNSADTQGWQDMRQIQTNIVASNPGVYMAFNGAVNFPSTGKMGDNLHYNFEGLKDMGEAFADELNNLLI